MTWWLYLAVGGDFSIQWRYKLSRSTTVLFTTRGDFDGVHVHVYFWRRKTSFPVNMCGLCVYLYQWQNCKIRIAPVVLSNRQLQKVWITYFPIPASFSGAASDFWNKSLYFMPSWKYSSAFSNTSLLVLYS